MSHFRLELKQRPHQPPCGHRVNAATTRQEKQRTQTTRSGTDAGAGLYFYTLTRGELKLRTVDLDNRSTSEHIKELACLRVEVPFLCISWWHTLLNHAEIVAFEQMPAISQHPTGKLRRSDVNYSNHDAPLNTA